MSSWLSADELRRLKRARRRRGDQQDTLRRVTVMAGVAAIALNGVLFAQTGLGSVGAGDVENAVLGLIGAALPGGSGGLQPAASPTPVGGGALPVVVSGGS